MLKDPEIDVRLLGRVLMAQGLRFTSGLEGRAYDMRPVRKSQAGTWLNQILASFEARTQRKATRFGLSGIDLLILD